MMKGEFEIPNDIKTDLAYCQQAIANHVKFHQEFCSITFNNTIERESLRAKKYLQEIEDEILDIGNEQKILFNRLRFYIDYYQLTKSKSTTDREKLTNQIRDELLHYANNANDIRPKNVQKRSNVNELYAKFYSSRENSVESNISTEIKDEPINDGMNVVMQPQIEIGLQTKPQWSQAMKKYSARKSIEITTVKQNPQSLLKPVDERSVELSKMPSQRRILEPLEPIIITPPQEEQPPELIKGRFNLRQALAKAAAKDDPKPLPEISISTKSPETVPFIPSPKSATTISSASNSSTDEIDGLKDDEKLEDIGQERFLGFFGLCTESQFEYLKNRRPLRKKRHCTSAERRDYHNNGKYKLYEEQFLKRGRRQFLYSPPATRAKKRVASVAVDKQDSKAPLKKEFVIIPKRPKPVATKTPPTISQTDIDDKVCVSCYKPNNLLGCRMCCAQYHLVCHLSLTNPAGRRVFCPLCIRKKVINIKHGLDMNRISLDIAT